MQWLRSPDSLAKVGEIVRKQLPDSLRKEIAALEETLADEIKLKRLIAKQLGEIKKKYAQPRRSTITSAENIEIYRPEDHVENYPAHFFLTADGYVVTNHHVIEGGSTYTIQDWDGKEYEATLVGSDSTNDVALLVFVPFTLPLLKQIGCDKAAVPMLVLQTIAANLGSMLTPVGNPQNLFLYTISGMGIAEFFAVTLPYVGVSYFFLYVFCYFQGRTPLETEKQEPKKQWTVHDKAFLIALGILFLFCLLASYNQIFDIRALLFSFVELANTLITFSGLFVVIQN